MPQTHQPCLRQLSGNAYHETDMVERRYTPDEWEQIEQHMDLNSLVRTAKLQNVQPKANRTQEFIADSPFSGDSPGVFHVNWPEWYCYQTNEGGRGGVEFVITYLRRRVGQIIDRDHAAQWLLDNKVSHLSDSTTLPTQIEPSKAQPPSLQAHAPEPNQPIRQNLVPSLDMDHPYLSSELRISSDTCQYLGIGYYAGKTSRLRNRLIFQQRGVQAGKAVVLSHVGRALDEETQPQWLFPKGYKKHLELYNQDKLLLDSSAIEQVRQTGQIVLVAGAFDAARLVDAGLLNVVAALDTRLSTYQCRRLKELMAFTNAGRCLIILGRAAHQARDKLCQQLNRADIQVVTFDWERQFQAQGSGFGYPENLENPHDFKNETLIWLREHSYL